MLNSVLWKLWMCFWGKYKSYCCIGNNALEKPSKQQITYVCYYRLWTYLLPVTVDASNYTILCICLITFKFVSCKCEAKRSRLWMLNSPLKTVNVFLAQKWKYFFIRNNALEKSSKYQIICLLLLLPMKISYCLRLDLDLLLHTVNTIILCYEIVPKSAYALPRRAARTESCRLYGSSFTIHMSLAYWKMRWTVQTDACGWGLHDCPLLSLRTGDGMGSHDSGL